MAYTKTTWKDRVVEFANRYKDQALNQYTFTRDEGTITEAGTQVTAAVMNKLEQGVYNALLHGKDTGNDDTYVLNLDTTLAEGLYLFLTVTTTNTDSCSLSIDNGVTSKSIVKFVTSTYEALDTGDIIANNPVLLYYDGTRWVLVGRGTDATSLSGYYADTNSIASKIPIRDSNGYIQKAQPTKIYGTATYTDAIPASSTLTKNIPLGASGYAYGKALIKGSAIRYGVIVEFCTDNTKTLVTGGQDDYQDHPCSWSRTILGRITDAVIASSSYYGGYVTGNSKIRINECYINGTNLTIIFENTDTNAQSLNCTVEWQVW